MCILHIFHLELRVLHITYLWPKATSMNGKHNEGCTVLHNNGTQHYNFIKSFKMLYLCPNGNFNFETFAKPFHQFHELLITILKAMTKNQVADDVGDSVVDDEVWIEWFPFTIKQKIRCYLCICDFVSFLKCHCAFTTYCTFIAFEDFCTICKFIQDDGFKWLLAKSKIFKRWKCKTPLLLPCVAITEN